MKKLVLATLFTIFTSVLASAQEATIENAPAKAVIENKKETAEKVEAKKACCAATKKEAQKTCSKDKKSCAMEAKKACSKAEKQTAQACEEKCKKACCIEKA